MNRTIFGHYVDDIIDSIMMWTVVVIIVFAALLCVGLLIHLFTNHEVPSLFCANGSIVHASPTTEIIGKTPVDGVLYTCP